MLLNVLVFTHQMQRNVSVFIHQMLPNLMFQLGYCQLVRCGDVFYACSVTDRPLFIQSYAPDNVPDCEHGDAGDDEFTEHVRMSPIPGVSSRKVFSKKLVSF